MNAEGSYCKYCGKEYSKIWLTIVSAKQANRIGSVWYKRWGPSCGIWLLGTWVRGLFSVWRWVEDEGRSSSIMDDSSSALTFSTWIYLYTAAPLQGEFKNTVYTAQHGGQRVRWGFCVFTPCMCLIIRAGVCFCACRLIKHIYPCQMSEVHCSTLLTSNVTNNFFLPLYCSNPFSGFWNGNIITFLWCGAFDKSAACCAECLTELDVSPKPSPCSTLLLFLTLSAGSLFSPFSSHPQYFSLASPKRHSASLSFSTHRYCSG